MRKGLASLVLAAGLSVAPLWAQPAKGPAVEIYNECVARPYVKDSRHSPRFGYYLPMKIPLDSMKNESRWVEFESQEEALKCLEVKDLEAGIRSSFKEVSAEAVQWFYAQDRVSCAFPAVEGKYVVWRPVWLQPSDKGWKVTIPKDYLDLVSMYAKGRQAHRTYGLESGLRCDVVRCEVIVSADDKGVSLSLDQVTRVQYKGSGFEDFTESELRTRVSTRVDFPLRDAMCAAHEIISGFTDGGKMNGGYDNLNVSCSRVKEKGKIADGVFVYTIKAPASKDVPDGLRFIVAKDKGK